MKRVLLVFFGLALLVTPAVTQTLNQKAASLNASATTCPTVGACLTLQLGATDNTVNIQANGTFSSTLQFEAAASNGSQWSAISCPTWGGGAAVSSATATGAWVCSVPALGAFRVRQSSYTSGAAIISLSSGPGPANIASLATPQNLSTTSTPSFAGVPLVGGVPTTVNVTTDFTTINNTSLQTISGLTVTLPANAATNVPFSCNLLYSQATANVAVAFGIQSATISPTNIMAMGDMFTAASTDTQGQFATLATTTATAIVSATPSATASIFIVTLNGLVENPSNASTNVVNFMVSTATGTDAVTVKRGSYCRLY